VFFYYFCDVLFEHFNFLKIFLFFKKFLKRLLTFIIFAGIIFLVAVDKQFMGA